MNIGAFFDIDGTLLPPPSLERRFLRSLCQRGEFGVSQAARWLARFVCRGACNWSTGTDSNKAHLVGLRPEAVEGFAIWLERNPLTFYPAALERVARHAAQGHRVFLVSGTLAPLARVVARRLPCLVMACATEFEVCEVFQAGRVERRWTGEIEGEAVCGPGKARVIERLAAAHGLDLSRSFAYGDAWSDRWMLARVGHPAAVNPCWRLARMAKQRSWPILKWRVTSVLPERARYECKVTASTKAAFTPQQPVAAAEERR